MTIPRKIYYTPEMQQAYMQAVTRGRDAGYVNPHRRAAKAMSAQHRSETERLRGLDRAGEERAFRERAHEEDLAFRYKGLASQERRFQDELSSNIRGSRIATMLGAGTLGLGLMDARKQREAAAQQRQSNIGMTHLQLNWLRKTNPAQYEWLLTQPAMIQQLMNLGIDSDLYGSHAVKP